MLIKNRFEKVQMKQFNFVVDKTLPTAKIVYFQFTDQEMSE